MKVKIFVLVAAFFMLMGGSAWAQSEVKGDVNKDGVVNEQDIAAILAIMAKNNGVAEKTKYYWYVGQTEPTSSNYTTLASQVTSYPTTYDYTVETRGFIYVLVSNSKTLSKIIDTSNGFDINYKETTSTVSGYKLYKTAAVAAGCPLKFTISDAR